MQFLKLLFERVHEALTRIVKKHPISSFICHVERGKEIHWHVCHISKLPHDYETSAIITENEGWVDLQDFGWRILDEPGQANEEAL